MNKEAARVYTYAGRVENAAKHFERAVAAMESDAHAWGMLVSCYHALGDSAGLKRAAEMSTAQAEKVLARDPSNGAAMAVGASGFAALGQPERAREWMDRAMLIDPDNLNMRYNFACMLAAHLGDREGALRLLERILAAANGIVVRAAQNDPDLVSVRDDPRFEKALAAAQERLRIKRAGQCRLTMSAS